MTTSAHSRLGTSRHRAAPSSERTNTDAFRLFRRRRSCAPPAKTSRLTVCQPRELDAVSLHLLHDAGPRRNERTCAFAKLGSAAAPCRPAAGRDSQDSKCQYDARGHWLTVAPAATGRVFALSTNGGQPCDDTRRCDDASRAAKRPGYGRFFGLAGVSGGPFGLLRLFKDVALERLTRRRWWE